MASVLQADTHNSGGITTSRLALIAEARTFEEVVGLVPYAFREHIKEELLEPLRENARRWVAALSQHEVLVSHVAKETFPPQFGSGPVFQAGKAFVESDPESWIALKKGWTDFRKDQLNRLVKAKKAEYEFYANRCKLEHATSTLHQLLKRVTDLTADIGKGSYRLPSPKSADDLANQQDIGYTKAVKQGWQSDVQKAIVWEYGAIHNQVIHIVRLHKYRDQLRILKKKDLKTTADNAMDVDTQTFTKGDINKLIDERMLQARLPGPKGKAPKGKGRIPYKLLSQSSNEIHRAETGTYAQYHTTQNQEESPEDFTLPLSVTKEGWARFWKRSINSEVVNISYSVYCNKDWSYAMYSSYPDEILDLPLPIAIYILHTRATDDDRYIVRFRGRVHVEQGVLSKFNLDSSILNQLSSGTKYLFATKFNPDLVRSAWDDFKQRLRWRFYFDVTNPSDEETFYDPDYQVQRKTISSSGPEANEIIENALKVGDTFVSETTLNPINLKSFVNWKDIYSYLEERNLLALPSDKNLGITVVTKDWFIEHTNALLTPNNYSIFDDEIIEDNLRSLAVRIANFTNHTLVRDKKQIVNYLLQYCPKGDEDWKPALASFYGIPKIHKTPWKMRPIAPAFNLMQSPISTYLTKALQPLLKDRPYVLHSTKDLCLKLSQLKLNNRCFIVTGDVTAFYPSISHSKVKLVVENMLLQAGFSHPRTEHLLEALDICLSDFYVRFNGISYQQLSGLPMGLSIAPVLANLYGAYFEELIVPNIGVTLYGRYLDDVFAIIESTSSKEALHIASHIQFDDCHMEWDVSETHCHFLDLHVYILGGKANYMPFRKAMSHFERIPWDSSHPFDVKKGVVLGEVSRIATLCSDLSSYEYALNNLRVEYRARGYPDRLLRSWIKYRKQQAWKSRLEKPSEKDDEDLFVTKTEFNPVWSSFDFYGLTVDIRSSILSAHIQSKDRSKDSYYTRALPGGEVRARGFEERMVQGRWLLSRKRTQSLGDRLSTLKKKATVP